MARYIILAILSALVFIILVSQTNMTAQFKYFFTRSTTPLEISSLVSNSTNHYTSQEWIDDKEGKAYANYGDESCIKRADQDMMRFLFRSWIALAEHLDVTYSLNHGSLLGAWRNGQMVPYDTDIDLFIQIKDMEILERFFMKNNTWSTYKGKEIKLMIQRDWRVPEVDRTRIRCDNKVSESHSDKCAFVQPTARLLYNEESYVEVYVYTITYDIVHHFVDPLLDVKFQDYFPFKRCMFMDTQTYCPQNPKVVLQRIYGNLQPGMICENTRWINKT